MLKEIIVRAISGFLEKDSELLRKGVCERAIAHKLAEHLQKQFNGTSPYNVDCEYNRIQGKTSLIKTLGLDPDSRKKVFPDIVVHKRGRNKNLLVLELKKKTADRNEKEFDYKKLKAYTKELGYELGVFMEFDCGNIWVEKYFKNGDECFGPMSLD